MSILKKDAISLCNFCYEEVPAKVIEENNRVYILKKCPNHGEFKGLLETGAEFYKRFAHLDGISICPFDNVIIPITHRCNMNCSYCYAPYTNRPDMKKNEIMDIIKNTDCNVVCLSGGEPTLYDNLHEIIEEIGRLGKRSQILTNGLKLADIEYVKYLKKAGLKKVFFSFDSFKEDFYRKIKSLKSNCGASGSILGLKKAALKNLKDEGMKILFSVTLVPGMNDDEMKDIYEFCSNNQDIVSMLRIRSCKDVGKNVMDNKNGYFSSEIIDMLSNALGISTDELYEKYLVKDEHTPHHVIFKIKGLKVRVINWPTIENIDLTELHGGVCYSTKDGKKINFCHSNVLDSKEIVDAGLN